MCQTPPFGDDILFTVRETIEATRRSQLHYVNVMQMLSQENTESLCGCVQRTAHIDCTPLTGAVKGQYFSAGSD